ncbi:MAG: hypothetical protein OXI61_01915 [Candidatus Poribacteria bacterium]|nr:hypothetical protein [Candidatus Poribacteria bacterium]
MEAKPYPIKKRRILAELAKNKKKEFLMFFDEIIGRERRRHLSQILPSLKKGGFIKLEMRLKQQAIFFVSELTREKEIEVPTSGAWETFGKVWALWVQSKSQLNEILLGFDNKSDFDENHKCITPPNSELDIQCFHNLLNESLSAEVDQETIRSFYEYGYFNKDEQIEAIIDRTLPRDEIERRQRLEQLVHKINKLAQTVDKLSQDIKHLKSIVSTMKSANELERKFTQQIAEMHRPFETQLQQFEEEIIDVHKSLETQLSNTESNSTQMVGLLKQINSLDSRLSGIEESVNSFENKLLGTEFATKMEQKISQLDQQMQDEIQSFEARLDVALNKAITIIKTEAEEQHQTTDAPRIAHEAVRIGNRYGAHLRDKTERYSDETDYLSNFSYGLRKFGVTDSEETATAIHVAMKAFPALEITDDRILKVWRMLCGEHLYFTTIHVEIGWLGLQDWFPSLFAEECLKERLERVDLEISIKKMLELGDMPWIIYLINCDRSFPESYLPHFLDWIGGLCKDGIRVFLIRCLGTNRCETNEDFYERVACLPNPQDRESIEAKNLRPLDILTLSKWKSWCRSDQHSQYEIHSDFLENLRSIVENKGGQIPMELLREIQHYVRLSHDLLASTRALDWALKLRFLPWIENQPKMIDGVLSMLDQDDNELQHFPEGLQQAREKANESN